MSGVAHRKPERPVLAPYGDPQLSLRLIGQRLFGIEDEIEHHLQHRASVAGDGHGCDGRSAVAVMPARPRL